MELPEQKGAADEFGTPKGSGLCAHCGGLGVIRDKPWKPNRETMTCGYCFGPDTPPDEDRLVPVPASEEPPNA